MRIDVNIQREKRPVLRVLGGGVNGEEREARAFKEAGGEKVRKERSGSSGWTVLIISFGRRGMGELVAREKLRNEENGAC